MKKIEEIHILRGFATCAVVLIHLLNLALINIPQEHYSSWFYVSLYQLFQFAVPCFIFISALVLAYQYQNKKISLVSFYKDKFIKIFIPYVVWSFVYLLGMVLWGQIPAYKLLKPSAWFYWLAYGRAYTHLYFIPLILKFYILAPFFLWGIKKLKTWCGTKFWPVLLVAALPQIAIYWINRLYIYQYFKASSSLILWYWFLIIIGLWIGLHYENWTERIKKYFAFTSLIYILSILLYLTIRLRNYAGLPISTFYFQMTWYAYTLLTSIMLLKLSTSILHHAKLHKTLNWIATYSLGIYFLHPSLTLVLKKLINTSNPLLIFIILSFAFIFITGLCGYTTKFLQSFKLTAFTMGGYKKSIFLNKKQAPTHNLEQ